MTYKDPDYQKKYRTAHADRKKELSRLRYLRRSPETKAEYAQHRKAKRHRLKAADPEAYRRIQYAWVLDKRYGISLKTYDSLKEVQGGVCAICRQKETTPRWNSDGPMDLVVDHCHDSGEVRGLLCGACNRALGLLREDSRIIQAMLEYLERWQFLRTA